MILCLSFKAACKLERGFVQKRLKGDGTPFKGFAGELLACFPLASFLRPHVSCFNKFCTIVDVMKMGDETVKLAANHRGTPQFVYWDLWRKECNPQDALYTAFGTRVGQATGQFELFPHRAETSTMQSNRIKSFCKL